MLFHHRSMILARNYNAVGNTDMISKLQNATQLCQNLLKRIFSRPRSPARKNELGSILKEIIDRNSDLHTSQSLLKARLNNGNFLHIYAGVQNQVEIIEYDNNYEMVSFSCCADLQAIHLRTTELDTIHFIDADVRQAFDVLIATVQCSLPEVLHEFPAAELKAYKVNIHNQLQSKFSGRESNRKLTVAEPVSCSEILDTCQLPGFNLSLSPSGLSVTCFQDYLTKYELDSLAENDVSASQRAMSHIDKLFASTIEELKWKQRVKAIFVRHQQTITTLIDELAVTPDSHEVIKALLYLESMADFALQEELQVCNAKVPTAVHVPRFG